MIIACASSRVIGTSKWGKLSKIFIDEKSTAILNRGSADRLIRVIFAEHENDSNDTRWLLERLAKLDKIYHSENTFETGDDGWKIVV